MTRVLRDIVAVMAKSRAQKKYEGNPNLAISKTEIPTPTVAASNPAADEKIATIFIQPSLSG